MFRKILEEQRETGIVHKARLVVRNRLEKLLGFLYSQKKKIGFGIATVGLLIGLESTFLATIIILSSFIYGKFNSKIVGVISLIGFVIGILFFIFPTKIELTALINSSYVLFICFIVLQIVETVRFPKRDEN